MGCGDVRLLRTIGGLDVTGQERAALNKLTMPHGLLGRNFTRPPRLVKFAASSVPTSGGLTQKIPGKPPQAHGGPGYRCWPKLFKCRAGDRAVGLLAERLAVEARGATLRY